MKSVFVDWHKEYNSDRWDFVGRSTLLNHRGEWSENNQDGVDADDGYPIYNFAYPLFKSDVSEEEILAVCEKTNCTVVLNNQDDKYYLSLTGCGMDMSQDIALAYMIVDGCIDWDFLEDVYIEGPFSVSRENYHKILAELKRQLSISIDSQKTKLDRVIELSKKAKGGKK